MSDRNEITAYNPNTFSDAWTFAERVAKTSIVPSALRGKPEEVFAVMATGDSLGLHPMSSLRAIHMIQGVPTLRADVMLALAMRAGVRVRYVRHDAEACVLEVERSGFLVEPVRVEWTIDMAKSAGLAAKDTWKSYPRAMLRARALSEACRLAAPDVLHGVYVPEEIEDPRVYEAIQVRDEPLPASFDEPRDPPKPETSWGDPEAYPAQRRITTALKRLGLSREAVDYSRNYRGKSRLDDVTDAEAGEVLRWMEQHADRIRELWDAAHDREPGEDG